MKGNKIIVIFCVLMLSFYSLQAQDSTQVLTSWMQAGIGPGFVHNIDDAASGFLGMQVQSNRHLFSFRTSYTGSVLGTAYQEFGILYGQILTPLDSKFFGSMSLGTGLRLTSESNFCIFGCGSGSSSSSEFKFTVPVQTSFQYRPIKFIGFGITGIGSFSPELSYSGLLFSIHVGRFRE